MSLLAIDQISKWYGPTRALAEFSLAVESGDIVALVGENGAGKSTLAKLLAGAERPDAGSISIQGRPVHLTSPRTAMRHGIAFIPQELAPVPTLSLAENIFLGDWPTHRGIVSQRALATAARREVRNVGVEDLDVTRRADTASLADLQLVEVVRAVRRRSALVVFDEPTASLNDAEARLLYHVISSLSQSGVGIIYISHRMDEVFTFSRRICVLRNGQKVAEHETGAVRRDTVIQEMIGRPVSSVTSANAVSAAAPVLLRLDGCVRTERPSLMDVSLILHAGEVVGLYGVRGSGADTIAAVLGGHTRADGGRLWLDKEEVPLPRHPRQARRLGIRYMPRDRKTEGLALRLSVADNVSLSNLAYVSRFGVLSSRLQRLAISPLVRLLRIRLGGIDQRVEELSGGNQQKVLLAGRLVNNRANAILVLEEPTRGVDVGSRAEIHETLHGLAAAGAGIVVFSSDVDEVISVCHRVLVVRAGRVVAQLAGSDRTQANAVRAATGVETGSAVAGDLP